MDTIELYRQLYLLAVTRITSGELSHGQKLWSIQKVAAKYHTSTKTVRACFDLLLKNDLIEAGKGKNAVVRFSHDNPEHERFHMQVINEMIDSIIDSFYAIQIILPGMLLEGARLCNDNDFSEMRKDAEYAARPNVNYAEVSRKLVGILRHFSAATGNVCFIELFDALNHLCIIPIGIPGYVGHIIQTLSQTAAYFQSLVSALQRLDSTGTWEAVHGIYTSGLRSLRSYLCENGFTVTHSRENIRFFWPIPFQRYSLRESLLRRLIHKIETGGCLPGHYLPSETSLSAEYEVSVKTVRSAIQRLNELHITQTIGRVGTHVLLNPVRESATPPFLTKMLPIYSDMLQMMKACVRPFSSAALSVLTPSQCLQIACQADDLLSSYEDGAYYAFCYLQDSLAHAVSSPILGHIYEQMQTYVFFALHYRKYYPDIYRSFYTELRSEVLSCIEAVRLGASSVLAIHLNQICRIAYETSNLVCQREQQDFRKILF